MLIGKWLNNLNLGVIHELPRQFINKNKYLLLVFLIVSINDTALPGVMRYIFSGQDARTTRVSSFNFVPHKSRNRCKFYSASDCVNPVKIK